MRNDRYSGELFNGHILYIKGAPLHWQFGFGFSNKHLCFDLGKYIVVVYFSKDEKDHD